MTRAGIVGTRMRRRRRVSLSGLGWIAPSLLHSAAVHTGCTMCTQHGTCCSCWIPLPVGPAAPPAPVPHPLQTVQHTLFPVGWRQDRAYNVHCKLLTQWVVEQSLICASCSQWDMYQCKLHYVMRLLGIKHIFSSKLIRTNHTATSINSLNNWHNTLTPI